MDICDVNNHHNKLTTSQKYGRNEKNHKAISAPSEEADLFLSVLLISISFKGYAAVTITTANATICKNYSSTGSTPTWTTLGTITVTEGAKADIGNAVGTWTVTVTLKAPTGWQFNSAATATTGFTTGKNITSVTASAVTSASVTITINGTGKNQLDVFTIGNLQVEPTSTSPAAGNIVPSATPTGTFKNVTTATNFGTLTPSPGAFSTVTSVCSGSTVNISDGTTGGTWTSSNTSVATIGSTSRVVTGVSAGTTTISYFLSTGCYSSETFTVYQAPSASITGSTGVCTGYTTTLSNGVTGGTWSSATTTKATINSSTGVVTPVAAGNSVITYTMPGSCKTTTTVTVSTSPGPISGTSVCTGATITLSDGTTGGAWTSSNTSVATVATATRVVTGVTAGSTNISYTIASTGCYAYEAFTVNQSPTASIGGNSKVCTGFTTTLSDATAGGTWSSGTTANATIDPNTGIVTGIATGNTTITYTMPGSCKTTTVVTVNASPAAITSGTGVCNSSTITLSDATAGGTWTSSSSSIATVGSSSGVVTGVSVGTTNISYTLTSTGCYASEAFTVYQTPTASITGTTTVCTGVTTTLSDATSGGTWSSGTTSKATIDPNTGIVTGVASGNATISYTMPGSCSTTTLVTVNASPAAISNGTGVCNGSTITLSDATASGTWSSDNVSVATVGPSSSVVSGVSVGTANISYILPTGCSASEVFTVYQTPSLSITGNTTVCAGVTSTLSDATTGGTWSSGTTAKATIDPNTGIVTGVASGIATISYTMPGSCSTTTLVTVNLTAMTITNGTGVCNGSTITLSDATAGGTWTSSSTSVATVGSSSRVVTGVAVGTTNISYTLASGCNAYETFTVYATPSPSITGITTVCTGGTTTLSNAVTGGTWSSGTTTIAIIDPNTGIVSPVTNGTTLISYTMPGSCSTTTLVTVNPSPVSITNGTGVCSGSTITLSDATAGGTWTSSSSSVATVGSSSRVVSGVSVGNTTISYTLATGCSAYETFTVYQTPSASITGATTVCAGNTTTLSDAISGGTWSSGTTAKATIDPNTGIVTAAANGNTTITYTMPGSCSTTTLVTVNITPAAISNGTGVCSGSTITLSDGTAGGTWTSSSSSVATVGSSSRVVTGVTAGTTNISYTLATGCNAFESFTVYQAPSASITGATTVCAGNTTTLSDAISGGTWSSGTTAKATIDPNTGIVTAVANGNTTITYTMPGSCSTTTLVTVNITPAAISNGASVCTGSTITLSDGTAGGTWTSSSSSVATVGSSSRVVTGVSSGTTNISYTLATGCNAYESFTVNQTPSTILGTAAVCTGAGNTTTLSDAVTGGTWSSSLTTKATIDPNTGIVTPVAAGNTTITYTATNSCTTTTVVTVNASPAAISSGTGVCNGSTVTLSDATAGGTWTSSSSSVATVGSSSRVVSGVSVGTTNISYTLTSTGCYASEAFTVYQLPSPSITGTTTVCAGSTSTLSDATSGGTWSSSTSAKATIDPNTGIVTGVAAGNATITYTMPGGCTTTTLVTVNLTAAAINGTSVCNGSTVTLSDATAGGTWTSTTSSIATIGSSSGVVSGVSIGSTTISYTLGSGCYAAETFTVYATPSPSITGATSVCKGYTTTLSDATAGGTWSSGSPGKATIDPNTGVVSAVANGNTTITYTMPGSCTTTTLVTINNTPAAISSGTSVCTGSTITLSDATGGGGTWTSSNSSVATIGSSSRVVTGVTTGTTNISYTLATGCYATEVFDVKVTPGTIAGVLNTCVGSTTQLSDASLYGTWTSSNSSVATIDPNAGLASGVLTGTITVTYSTGCGSAATKTFTVNALPAVITVNTTVCANSSSTLSDITGTGTWSNDDATVATITSTTGITTGVGAGTTNVTYTVSSTGCTATTVLTVNAQPDSIIGTTGICLPTILPLSDDVAGGTWSSSNTSVATVDPNTGVASGFAVGVAIISYTLSSTGCAITDSLPVIALPVITSATPGSSCGADTVNLAATCNVGEVNWYPSSSSDGSDQLALGSTYTTDIISATTPYYVDATDSNGCTTASRTEVDATINTVPSIITTTPNSECGPGVVSLGATSDIGTVNWYTASSGGSSTATGITYTTPTISTTTAYYVDATDGTTGCTTTSRTEVDATVNPLPASGTISGSGTTACIGATITLSDGTAGGVWALNNLNASMDNSSLVLTGLDEGTDTVSYIVTNICGSDTSTFAVSVLPLQNNIYTCVGTGVAGYGGEGGVDYQTMLNTPKDVFEDASGNLYICETQGQRVRKVSPTGIVVTVAGTGTAGNTGDGGPATAATLSQPIGIWVDNSGNIFINCNLSHTVRKIDNTGIITTIAGTPNTSGSGGDGGPATAATLSTLVAITGDNNGNLYIADGGNNKVRRVNTTTGIITTIAGTSKWGYTGDGGPATAAEFNVVRGLVLDHEGNLFIADAVNNCIRKLVLATDTVTTVAGTGTAGYSGDNGPATAATLNQPCRLTYDQGDYIYISDQLNNVIRRLSLKTGTITTAMGTGIAGYGSDNGPATSTQLNSPSGMCVDKNGNFYVADFLNERVRIAGIPGSARITGPSSVVTGNPVTYTVYSAITSNATYQWQKNGSNVGSGATTYVDASPSNGDVYSCIITIAPPCTSAYTDTSNSIKLTVLPGRYAYTTGVETATSNKKVNIYPNPVQNIVNIDATNLEEGPVNIEIYDQLGHLVFSKSEVASGNQFSEKINMGSLASGVYIISLTDKANTPIRSMCIKN